MRRNRSRRLGSPCVACGAFVALPEGRGHGGRGRERPGVFAAPVRRANSLEKTTKSARWDALKSIGARGWKILQIDL